MSRSASSPRILGIDPGSVATGFGIVERAPGRDPVYVAHGTLRPPRGATLAVRLSFLTSALREIVEIHRPNSAVIEQVFVSASPRSALVLGQARGALLSVLGEFGLEVDEIAPRAIKRAVTGSGAAGKAQVQASVAQLLKLDARPASDAADALAAAICQANAGPLVELGKAAGTGRRRRGGRRWTVAPRSKATPR